MRLKAMAIVFVLLTPACGQEGGGRASALEVRAVDFGFQGVPAQFRGGGVDLTFTNNGRASHEFGLIQAEGVSLTDFKKGFGPVLEGGPFPDFMKNGAGAAVTEAKPGQTVTRSFTLPEGEYYLFCALDDAPGGEGEDQPTGKPHLDLGMIQPVKVVGTNTRELDAAGGEFVARDYTFDVPATVEVGKKEYVFRNASRQQWHHMVLNEFDEGVSKKEALNAWKTLSSLEEGAAPPEGTPMPKPVGAAGVFSPGLGQTIELDLKAGHTYLAMCFISDVAGGPPHVFAHNMVKAFTIPRETT